MKMLAIFTPFFGKYETSTSKEIKAFESPAELEALINEYLGWGETDLELNEPTLNSLATYGGDFIITTGGGDWDDAGGYFVLVTSKGSYADMLKEDLEKELKLIESL